MTATLEAPVKPHVSNSQIELAGLCPEAYFRRYIENERHPPTLSMAKGTAVHGGAQENFRQKIESHRDLKAGDIVAAAVETFDLQLKGDGVTLAVDETARGRAIVVGEARDAIADMAEVHAKQQAPDYQPIAVEESIRIELPGPRDLLAVIDLRDTEGRVVDFKTSKRKKNKDEAEKSTQLTLYAAATQALTGQLPSAVRLDVVVQTTKKTDRQILDAVRNASHIEAMAHRINALEATIAAGVFMPTTRGNWKCADKWCEFFQTCRYIPESERRAGGDEE